MVSGSGLISGACIKYNLRLPNTFLVRRYTNLDPKIYLKTEVFGRLGVYIYTLPGPSGLLNHCSTGGPLVCQLFVMF